MNLLSQSLWQLVHINNDNLTQLYKIKEDEVHMACSMQGRNKKYIQNFDQETWREDISWET